MTASVSREISPTGGAVFSQMPDVASVIAPGDSNFLRETELVGDYVSGGEWLYDRRSRSGGGSQPQPGCQFGGTRTQLRSANIVAVSRDQAMSPPWCLASSS